MSYIVTTQVRTTATVRDLDGALTNTTMVCTVKEPDGTLQTPAVVNESTGVYHADVLLDAAGAWAIEWQGSVTIIVAGQATVRAALSKVDRDG